MTYRFARLLALALILALAAGLLPACSDDDSPTGTGPEPPMLPDPADLTFDVDFFGTPGKAEQQNFANAALRAVVVTLMTDVLITPPVAAFAIALHSTPVYQTDGSWIWNYTFENEGAEYIITLRGEDLGDSAAWRLSVTAPTLDIFNEIWFQGTTGNGGRQGFWTFYDILQATPPAVATLAWSRDAVADTASLELVSLSGTTAGQSLTFGRDGDWHRIDFVEVDSPDIWFIRWNAATGVGSLMVPDYNGGLEACWDENRFDTVCGEVLQ